ncbi:hypothetical protein [Streptomyces phaeochromogenes]
MSRNDDVGPSEVPSRRLLLKGALAAGALTAVPGVGPPSTTGSS